MLDTQVLIVGAGPIGSLVGLQLRRQGVDAIIIDAEDKSNAPLYGRACTLWCVDAFADDADAQAALARDLCASTRWHFGG